MITFITLFLGLTNGLKTIDVAVGDPVVAVELRLDAEVVARREGPPWRFDLDLGPELAPHRLEAVGLDRDGQEVGRAVQWLNLPRPPADARVLIEPGTPGAPAMARISWESLAGTEPRAVVATFDGAPLEVQDPKAIPLPASDPAQLHFLRAELIFSQNVRSVVEATLGGTYLDRVNTELTAVPVTATGSARRALENTELDGWFAGRDASGATLPLNVVAIDQGAPIVIIVPDRGAQDDVRRRLNRIPGARRESAERRIIAASRGRLAQGLRARVLWPVTRVQNAVSGPYDLFLNSRDVSAQEAGLALLIADDKIPIDVGTRPQRLADAVAVAAVEAASRRRPRAVVLLLGNDPEDQSFMTPEVVRRYLAKTNTPLHVWTTGNDPGPATTAWGPAERVTSMGKLDRQSRLLSKELKRQWIVWLDGRHLPQDITLTSRAHDLQIVR